MLNANDYNSFLKEVQGNPKEGIGIDCNCNQWTVPWMFTSVIPFVCS